MSGPEQTKIDNGTIDKPLFWVMRGISKWYVDIFIHVSECGDGAGGHVHRVGGGMAAAAVSHGLVLDVFLILRKVEKYKRRLLKLVVFGVNWGESKGVKEEVGLGQAEMVGVGIVSALKVLV